MHAHPPSVYSFSPLSFLIEWALLPVPMGRKNCCLLFEKGVALYFPNFDFPSLKDTYAKFG